MKSLFKWQIVSFLSRGLAMTVGIFQSFIILRLLSLSDWGLVQLALSIGGALGIYQNLGLASASTREIASTNDDTKVFKIFVTSVLIRYIIAIPLGLGLIIFSSFIAKNVYNFDSLILPLKIYGFTVLIQGFQTILNSVISGTKRFKSLFTYQVFISVISLIIYVPFVYYFGLNGYFYAFLIFNFISTVILTFIAFLPLKANLEFPSKSDFVLIFKDLFSITMIIFITKIIYINWEKFGNNALGFILDENSVALFAFATMFAKKIMSISDSVTDVNLPVLSKKFAQDFTDFKQTFIYNFNKIFLFVIFSSFVAIFWSKEIVYFLAGYKKYLEFYNSFDLILPLLLSFIFYSFINIFNASILIPAKMNRSMLLSFLILLFVTILSFFVFQQIKFTNLLVGMSFSMLFGTICCTFVMVIMIKRKLSFYALNLNHILNIVLFTIFGSFYFMNFSFQKVLYFIFLTTLLIMGFLITNLITKKELVSIKNKILIKIFNIIKPNDKKIY